MDRFMLEYEIKRNGFTVAEFCKAIGINKSTYYRKVKCESEFTQAEIQATIDLLHLKSPVGIFFTSKVS